MKYHYYEQLVIYQNIFWFQIIPKYSNNFKRDCNEGVCGDPIFKEYVLGMLGVKKF